MCVSQMNESIRINKGQKYRMQLDLFRDGIKLV